MPICDVPTSQCRAFVGSSGLLTNTSGEFPHPKHLPGGGRGEEGGGGHDLVPDDLHQDPTLDSGVSHKHTYMEYIF